MNEKTENDKNDEKETSIVNKINDYFKMCDLFCYPGFNSTIYYFI